MDVYWQKTSSVNGLQIQKIVLNWTNQSVNRSISLAASPQFSLVHSALHLPHTTGTLLLRDKIKMEGDRAKDAKCTLDALKSRSKAMDSPLKTRCDARLMAAPNGLEADAYSSRTRGT